MVGVVIGAESHIEKIAGPVAHLAQEFRFWLAVFPALLQGNEFAIAQTETRNIEGMAVACSLVADEPRMLRQE